MTAWDHLLVAPVVLPLLAGATLLLVERHSARAAAVLSAVATLTGLAVALALVQRAAHGTVQAYLVGNWAAPYGIALALDRLSALMLLLTAVLGVAGWLYAAGGDAGRSRHFHSLWQFQLLGLNGAFLTADLFNLFVFFEVLLIASYGLLLHGAGRARLRAALHYVSFNLAGSALFLVAVSLLYGLAGTLSLADLAQRVPQLPPDRGQLVRSAALLLIVVFGIKAALLPLYFWLPTTYGAASAPVAALFAVMTKVGVYTTLRVTTLVFGPDAGVAAQVTSPWLEALALGTLVLGGVGALAARQLRALIGNLVIASAGLLLAAVGLGQPGTIAAGLFYLVHSTLAAAAFFLLADRVCAARGVAGDMMLPASLGDARVRLGVLFFVLAVALAGLPPLGGFLGKSMLLLAAGPLPAGPAVVGTVLAASLLALMALARSGSMLFWRPGPPAAPWPAEAADAPMPARGIHGVAMGLLVVMIAGCAVFAGPLSRYCMATALQLRDSAAYRLAVLGAVPAPPAYDLRREMRERKAAAP